jgi:carbon monoxide dehydrogenase subunit G
LLEIIPVAEFSRRKAHVMTQFEGDKELPFSSAQAWQKLSDARFLVGCVPDVDSVSQSQSDLAVCVIRPGFAFVRGTLELTMRIVEAVPESDVRLLLSTKGIGSSSDVEAKLILAAQEEGTRIHWVIELKSLGGLLKAVPQGLIKAAAQKVINDVWMLVERRMREDLTQTL